MIRKKLANVKLAKVEYLVSPLFMMRYKGL